MLRDCCAGTKALLNYEMGLASTNAAQEKQCEVGKLATQGPSICRTELPTFSCTVKRLFHLVSLVRQRLQVYTVREVRFKTTGCLGAGKVPFSGLNSQPRWSR